MVKVRHIAKVDAKASMALKEAAMRKLLLPVLHGVNGKIIFGRGMYNGLTT